VVQQSRAQFRSPKSSRKFNFCEIKVGEVVSVVDI